MTDRHPSSEHFNSGEIGAFCGADLPTEHSVTLGEVLEHMDQITADRRDVQSLEALWTHSRCIREGEPEWPEAYMNAKQRGRLPAGDRDGGRTVAFLEGLLVGLQVNRRRS